MEESVFYSKKTLPPLWPSVFPNCNHHLSGLPFLSLTLLVKYFQVTNGMCISVTVKGRTLDRWWFLLVDKISPKGCKHFLVCCSSFCLTCCSDSPLNIFCFFHSHCFSLFLFPHATCFFVCYLSVLLFNQTAIVTLLFGSMPWVFHWAPEQQGTVLFW